MPFGFKVYLAGEEAEAPPNAVRVIYKGDDQDRPIKIWLAQPDQLSGSVLERLQEEAERLDGNPIRKHFKTNDRYEVLGVYCWERRSEYGVIYRREWRIGTSAPKFFARPSDGEQGFYTEVESVHMPGRILPRFV